MDDDVHPIFRNAPSTDARIWRYLTFAKYASLLQSASLHFTRVDQFDDHFEGAWPKSDYGHWESVSEHAYDNIQFMTDHLKRTCVAASCWIELSHESAAMWNLYAPGQEGVAITTTFGRLKRLLENVPRFDDITLAGAARVTYVDHVNDGLFSTFDAAQGVNALWPFMLKNKSYGHEHEVRALIMSDPGIDPMEESGYSIPISIPEFIDSIIINPFCRHWFVDAVRGITDQFGLGAKLDRSALSKDLFYISPARKNRNTIQVQHNK